MAEEILVEDNIEECESADTKSGVRPMLYIQQNINVCPTQQMATSQAIVPQSAPQLTAIINPVTNQVKIHFLVLLFHLFLSLLHKIRCW